jgi:hypothetical protein
MKQVKDEQWWEKAEEAYVRGRLSRRLLADWVGDGRDALVLELIRRGVRGMEEARMKALDAARKRSGEMPLSLEDIVDARLLPVGQRAIDSILCEGRFHRGVARLFAESPALKRRILEEIFPVSTRRFLDELEKTLPGLCAAEVEERFWMSHGSILGSLGMLDKFHDPQKPTLGEQRMWAQVHLLRDAMCGLFRAPSRSDFHQEMVHFRDEGRQWQLPIEKIATVRADGDYSRVWTCDGTDHYLRRTLREWEELLKPPAFFRVHRATLVHLTWVCPPYHASELRVKGDPELVPVSRRRQAEIENAVAACKSLRNGWVTASDHFAGGR